MPSVFTFIVSHSFFRFAIVGICNTFIDFGLFFTLYEFFGWSVIPANILAFSAAVTNSYLLNKYWSFSRQKSGNKSWRQFLVFILISLFSLSLGTGILVFGEPYASVLFLKIIGGIVIPLVNYFAYKLIVFKHQTA